MRDPKVLNEVEQEDLAAILLASPPLKKAYDLIQSFLVMVHKREGKRLDAWLAQVTESGLPELQSFAAGVEKDKEAVKAGLTVACQQDLPKIEHSFIPSIVELRRKSLPHLQVRNHSTARKIGICFAQ
jgi:hypothetical protein